MKKLLALSTLLISAITYGQQLSMLSSEMYLKPGFLANYYIKGDNICLIELKKNGYYYSTLDSKTLQKKTEPKLIIESKSATKNENQLTLKTHNFFKAITLGEKQLLFFVRQEKKDKTSKLFVQEINDLGDFIGTANMIARTDQWTNYELIDYSENQNNGLAVTSSPNKKLMLISAQNANIIKSTKDEIPAPVELKLYNNNMEEVASRKEELGIYMFGGKITLNDDGYMYCLSHILKSSTNVGTQLILTGLNIKDPNSKVFNTELKLDGKGILTASILTRKKNKLICIGTYSDLTKNGEVDDVNGIFYAKLNSENGTIESISCQQLDKTILNELVSEKKVQQGEGLGLHYYFKDLIELENGTIDIILQNTFNFWTAENTSDATIRNTYSMTGNILIANVNKEGQISWIKAIGRPFYSLLYWADSYSYLKNKNNVTLLFNDSEKNYDTNGQYLTATTNHKNQIYMLAPVLRNRALVSVNIDEDGNIKRKIFKRDKELIHHPNMSLRLDDNSLYFWSVKETNTLSPKLLLYSPSGRIINKITYE